MAASSSSWLFVRTPLKTSLKTKTHQFEFPGEIHPDDTIQALKQKVCDIEGVLPEKYSLFIAGQVLEDGRTLSDYDIEPGTTLTLFRFSGVFFVKNFVMGKQQLTLKYSPFLTIHEVKQMIEEKEGKIPVHVEVRFKFSGKQLVECRTLADYNIDRESTIYFFALLLGGGVFHIEVTDGNLVITSGSGIQLTIPTLHVSCQSDRFERGADYAGAVLWGLKTGECDWRMNGVHCRSGYIILKKTSSIALTESKEGQVHGKLFREVFGVEPSEANVVGAGFAYHKGEWKWNSKTFNIEHDKNSGWHNDDAALSLLEQQYVQAAIRNWITTGNQNLSVAAVTKADLQRGLSLPGWWCSIL